ncbi:hypothetical protein ACFLY3_01920 [Chloroflexota bacterium]
MSENLIRLTPPRLKRRSKMSEQVTSELQKLSAIATDMDLVAKLRTQAIQSIGNIGTHEALLALLDLAANEKLNVNERDLALKQARNIIKQGR